MIDHRITKQSKYPESAKHRKIINITKLKNELINQNEKTINGLNNYDNKYN